MLPKPKYFKSQCEARDERCTSYDKSQLKAHWKIFCNFTIKPHLYEKQGKFWFRFQSLSEISHYLYANVWRSEETLRTLNASVSSTSGTVYSLWTTLINFYRAVRRNTLGPGCWAEEEHWSSIHGSNPLKGNGKQTNSTHTATSTGLWELCLMRKTLRLHTITLVV